LAPAPALAHLPNGVNTPFGTVTQPCVAKHAIPVGWQNPGWVAVGVAQIPCVMGCPHRWIALSVGQMPCVSGCPH
jgi:hypothetical protein